MSSVPSALNTALAVPGFGRGRQRYGTPSTFGGNPKPQQQPGVSPGPQSDDLVMAPSVGSGVGASPATNQAEPDPNQQPQTTDVSAQTGEPDLSRPYVDWPKTSSRIAQGAIQDLAAAPAPATGARKAFGNVLDVLGAIGGRGWEGLSYAGGKLKYPGLDQYDVNNARRQAEYKIASEQTQQQQTAENQRLQRQAQQLNFESLAAYRNKMGGAAQENADTRRDQGQQRIDTGNRRLDLLGAQATVTPEMEAALPDMPIKAGQQLPITQFMRYTGMMNQRKMQADKPAQKPLVVAPGSSVMAPDNKTPVYTAPDRPQKPPQDLGVDPDTGKAYLIRPGTQVVPGTQKMTGVNTTNTLTSPTRTMKEMAQGVLPQIPKLNSQIDDLKAQLGPLAGRWNELWVNKVGMNNPAFAKLDQNLDLFASAVVLTHARGRFSEQYRQALKKSFSEAQSPEDLKARIAAAEDWVRGYATRGAPPPGGITAPKGPPVGTVVGDHRFKGGDPNDKNSWEIATPQTQQ